jgi:hypothetical protein
MTSLTPNQRSPAQNKAIHGWFKAIAITLNEAGYSVRDFYNMLESVGVDNTEKTVKDAFRAIGKKQYARESTADLTTKECTDVAEELNRILGTKGMHIPFPSAENKALLEYYSQL